MIEILQTKGVKIPNPASVYISKDVNPDRISGENVILYPGCRIIGEKSMILKGCRIGYEAPVTLENTLVGKDSKLNGGFFKDAVFAGNNSFGSGAHVREGTILEEEANAAHTVGLKQTILFPFVTLGSLINFCDCFMAGGTSRREHSEVGSSFIHFNYTPNQDKATPSMIGDVHKGVMLRSKPIFLGGQGGLVGPVRIGYGCITAAGSIIRKNEARDDRLILGGSLKEISIPRQWDMYKNVPVIFNNNIYYIAGLIALKSWYKRVRPLFTSDDFSLELVKGMQNSLDLCIEERIKRLAVFCDKLHLSKEILQAKVKNKKSNIILHHENAIKTFQSAKKIFKEACEKEIVNQESQECEQFIFGVEKEIRVTGKNYTDVIQNLDPKICATGSSWLHCIEKEMVEQLLI